ncbi:MAG: hypothetical protein UR31_C0026G0005 [Parcubacteria group bacterium GW2011_GWA2_33_14]|uniref:YgjP-like metallopeptidase domain-containing protein n=1 Tax=Candidatus Staskawiczbacteria bacterium RIFCSPHIGHO2_02_FULL_33_16 TaxID=1802204 RepID=A0A1G2HSR9_9BACT|nr:MAG: hypothetical protein UR31_C0026G0005 [Parcubacteria group bacterium GW2011_GWA2_33_14]OGZ65527.1 MAG: hypothetical protein A3D34_03865 [Candidatus Staskawiczbacteria bacterium RIFCSPHIGHO2_02_FULL_33_16]OGZ70613.1 MAG: hypothetical protein A2980_03635 [Candidatus Staskawiczbacteria bacterium RIFCSPLOWO2_01_FULL_33_13]
MAAKEFKKYKIVAEKLIKEKITHFNNFYHFTFNKIFIKNQKRRWGSCSSKKNLNFNYKIIFLKQELSNYIIVHELCHLKEMNHSKRFWKLVSQTVKNYKKLNKILKKTVIS